MCDERILDVQASIDSARKRRAWLGKAGLGHRVVLGVESEHDGVSRTGGLKEGETVSATINIMMDWLANNVIRVEGKACSGIADVNLPGCRGGCRSI